MAPGAIAFDFDGTIAYAPAGCSVGYSDPALALASSAALPAAIRLMRRLKAGGFDFHIVTGRDQGHEAPIRYWCRLFLGEGVPVWCRPKWVGLACHEQAEWKASVMAEIRAVGAVGDNHRIDRVAAGIAGVHYLDARVLRVGLLPTFSVVAGWMVRGPRGALARPGPMLDWPENGTFDQAGEELEF